MSHNTRCNHCKDRLDELFRYHYGSIEHKHKVQVPVHLEKLGEFTNLRTFQKLEKIYHALEGFKQQKQFVKSVNLQRCDIFIPQLMRIVELDETQHFSAARAIALEQYPKSFELGFSRKQWILYCRHYNSKDPMPPYRDEQRAWYDTIRDFLPFLIGYAPTIRIHIGDFAWCELDSSSKSDRNKFRELLSIK